MLCSVSRALAGLTTEYLIVSSKPPTGYYVDGVTACPVSRASAGLTEYLIGRISSPLHSRLSATLSWRHIWSSTHTKRPSLDHTRNCQPSPNQLSNFNFLRGHRLPPNRCHRFRHPPAQTTPHHSIIHTPQMIVYLAPNIFQFSKGSPPPTLHSWSQIRSSTRTNNSAQFDHPPTANTSPPSSTRQNSNFTFLRGHRLPPIDYARPRRQQSLISTIHLANLRRPLPHLG